MATTKREKILIGITCAALVAAIAAWGFRGSYGTLCKDRFYPFHYKAEDIQVLTLSSLLVEGDGPAGKGCTTRDPEVIEEIVAILNDYPATGLRLGENYAQPEPNTLTFLDQEGNKTVIIFRDEYVGVSSKELSCGGVDTFFYGGPAGYFQPLLDLLEEGFY